MSSADLDAIEGRDPVEVVREALTFHEAAYALTCLKQLIKERDVIARQRDGLLLWSKKAETLFYRMTAPTASLAEETDRQAAIEEGRAIGLQTLGVSQEREVRLDSKLSAQLEELMARKDTP